MAYEFLHQNPRTKKFSLGQANIRLDSVVNLTFLYSGLRTVIPAKAGIQIEKIGFRIKSGMTKYVKSFLKQYTSSLKQSLRSIMVQIAKPYADDLRNRFEETTTICFCVEPLLSGERLYTTSGGGLSQDDYGTIGPLITTANCRVKNPDTGASNSSINGDKRGRVEVLRDLGPGRYRDLNQIGL